MRASFPSKLQERNSERRYNSPLPICYTFYDDNNNNLSLRVASITFLLVGEGMTTYT